MSSRNRAPRSRSRSTDSAVRAPFNEGTSDVTNEAIPFNEGSIANAPQQYPMQEDDGSQRALADTDIKQSSADAPLQYPMQEDEGSQRALADTDIMQSSVSAPACEQSSVNLNPAMEQADQIADFLNVEFGGSAGAFPEPEAPFMLTTSPARRSTPPVPVTLQTGMKFFPYAFDTSAVLTNELEQVIDNQPNGEVGSDMSTDIPTRGRSRTRRSRRRESPHRHVEMPHIPPGHESDDVFMRHLLQSMTPEQVETYINRTRRVQDNDSGKGNIENVVMSMDSSFSDLSLESRSGCDDRVHGCFAAGVSSSVSKDIDIVHVSSASTQSVPLIDERATRRFTIQEKGKGRELDREAGYCRQGEVLDDDQEMGTVAAAAQLVNGGVDADGGNTAQWDPVPRHRQRPFGHTERDQFSARDIRDRGRDQPFYSRRQPQNHSSTTRGRQRKPTRRAGKRQYGYWNPVDNVLREHISALKSHISFAQRMAERTMDIYPGSSHQKARRGKRKRSNSRGSESSDFSCRQDDQFRPPPPSPPPHAPAAKRSKA